MIPEEAVEAAAKVMFDQSHFGGLTEWPDVRDEYCALMRPALEAALPYLTVYRPVTDWPDIPRRTK